MTAHDLSVVDFDGVRARIRIHCSAGFYVRSLAHDVGEAVGTGAVLEALVRTRAAGFETQAALPFEQLMTLPRDDVRATVRPMETLLTDLPAATLTPDGVEWARNGRELPPRILSAVHDAGPFAPHGDFQLQLTIPSAPKGRDIRRSGPSEPLNLASGPFVEAERGIDERPERITDRELSDSRQGHRLPRSSGGHPQRAYQLPH